MRSFRWWVAVSLTLPAVAAVQEAGAQALNPAYEYTQAGSGPPGTGYVLNVPGSYSYGNTYVSGAGSAPISDAQGTISPNVGFYDGYQFTISGAVANSATLTIDLEDLLQIDNLSARIFRAAGNTAPTLRAPVGGSLVEAWSMPISSGPSDGEAVILSNVLLNPGTYVLQIRGLVTGSAGGSYAGVLNLAAPTPVPLPAAAWLLVSGLGALGVVKRRARS
jgi:hypothetical protein